MTRILNFSNGKELKDLLEIIQKEQSKNKEQLLSNTLDSLYWKVNEIAVYDWTILIFKTLIDKLQKYSIEDIKKYSLNELLLCDMLTDEVTAKAKRYVWSEVVKNMRHFTKEN